MKRLLPPDLEPDTGENEYQPSKKAKVDIKQAKKDLKNITKEIIKAVEHFNLFKDEEIAARLLTLVVFSILLENRYSKRDATIFALEIPANIHQIIASALKVFENKPLDRMELFNIVYAGLRRCVLQRLPNADMNLKNQLSQGIQTMMVLLSTLMGSAWFLPISWKFKTEKKGGWLFDGWGPSTDTTTLRFADDVDPNLTEQGMTLQRPDDILSSTTSTVVNNPIMDNPTGDTSILFRNSLTEDGMLYPHSTLVRWNQEVLEPTGTNTPYSIRIAPWAPPPPQVIETQEAQQAQEAAQEAQQAQQAQEAAQQAQQAQKAQEEANQSDSWFQRWVVKPVAAAADWLTYGQYGIRNLPFIRRLLDINEQAIKDDKTLSFGEKAIILASRWFDNLSPLASTLLSVGGTLLVSGLSNYLTYKWATYEPKMVMRKEKEYATSPFVLEYVKEFFPEDYQDENKRKERCKQIAKQMAQNDMIFLGNMFESAKSTLPALGQFIQSIPEQYHAHKASALQLPGKAISTGVALYSATKDPKLLPAAMDSLADTSKAVTTYLGGPQYKKPNFLETVSKGTENMVSFPHLKLVDETPVAKQEKKKKTDDDVDDIQTTTFVSAGPQSQRRMAVSSTSKPKEKKKTKIQIKPLTFGNLSTTVVPQQPMKKKKETGKKTVKKPINKKTNKQIKNFFN